MNINVQSIHFDADTKLIDFIREKLTKLTQFTDGILSAEVFLRLEKDGENRENKLVEVRLAVPGSELFAKRQDKTFEEATIAAVEALRNQVVRTKDRAR
ncbi:MAG: HPF/RaiA family ribosome-associated protein [Flavobacteriales bacterium]|nr:MAG: HPF/RaiA family ribosome-associated protein [Flavobacteriales bacterium]